MNADGHVKQDLVTEYDFPKCDTSKTICIEVILTELGQALGEFQSDIQWIDPNDGTLIETNNIEPDADKHKRVIIIQFEAKLNPHKGEIEWCWLLPKFRETEMEKGKELSRAQHQSLGYFRIKTATSAGTFTMGQYSSLGRHLRKLQYLLGKMPAELRSQNLLPTCSLESPQCENCPSKPNCIPDAGNDSTDNKTGSARTIGDVLRGIVTDAKNVLGTTCWDEMEAGLGPRYGGLTSALAALTIGLRTQTDETSKFIPYEKLSAGEKYALSFALAKAQIPGEFPPVIFMEEPETALSPSAVAILIRNMQAIPTGEAPQVFISSHSESVLRCFSPDDVFIMGKGYIPKKLQTVIENKGTGGKGPFHRPEHLMMPGGPGALFADKILMVEGANDTIVSGHLDRLAANNTARSRGEHISFSAQGWCILKADNASEIPNCVEILQSLGKKVAALFDGDGTGKEYANRTKDLCPTFSYASNQYKDPTIEDALLAGFPLEERTNILKEYLSYPECTTCQKNKDKCWTNKGVDCPRGDRDDRKQQIQILCIKHYEENRSYPKAFETLLKKIESVNAGEVHELHIDV